MTVECVRAWDLVRHARHVGSVVATMTRLVVPVRKDRQMTLRLCCCELWLRASLVECLMTSVDLQIKRLLLDGTAYTLAARVALTAAGVSWTVVRVDTTKCAWHNLTLRVALVFVLVLVFLVATVALGVVRLGLARTATVLALLDGATLGVDVVQLAIYKAKVSPRSTPP